MVRSFRPLRLYGAGAGVDASVAREICDGDEVETQDARASCEECSRSLDGECSGVLVDWCDWCDCVKPSILLHTHHHGSYTLTQAQYFATKRAQYTLLRFTRLRACPLRPNRSGPRPNPCRKCASGHAWRPRCTRRAQRLRPVCSRNRRSCPR